MGSNWIILIYFGAALLAAVTATFAGRRHKEPGMLWILFILLSAAEWCIGNGLELISDAISTKVIWAKMEYFGILGTPTFYFLFGLEYNRLERWLTKRLFFLLASLSALILILVWTNEWHSLFWSSIAPNPDLPHVLVYSHGPAFWVSAVLYSFLLLAITSGLLIWRALRAPSVYRRIGALLFVGSLIPITGNLIYLANLSPFAGWDPTPIAFSVCGSLLAIAILRFRLFEIIPIARNLLIDIIPDGVLVLDRRQLIIDHNPAAAGLLGWMPETPFGKNAEDVLPAWPEWKSRLASEQIFEFTPVRNPSIALELRVIPLQKTKREFLGHMLVLRDITQQKHVEDELQQTNQVLRDQLEEIRHLQETLHDQVIRDPLTGLYNRRYLAETLEREMARAQRTAEPVSLVIIDLDHFKTLNDTYGHRTGDEILRRLSSLLQHQTRRGDISCRYGGDEFVVILPGTPMHIAWQRTEQWRSTFADTAYMDGDKSIRLTFSAGVAIFPQDGATAEELLTAADKALYAAKSSGRNRIASLE
jgi:diguanylate cyclase (GGDEF)-like protein/PAS domain S-box-containing protein